MAFVRTALVAALIASSSVAVQAANATIQASETQGFARIVLSFDNPPRAAVRVTPSIVVLTFSEPVTITSEKIASELPSYVSVVRLDPDGKGLRLALTRGVRANLMEAGERIYLDLLPQNWVGLPPGLPREVVEDLARRAREAEARVRDVLGRGAPAPGDLVFRTGSLPTLDRIVLEAPSNVPISSRRQGTDLVVTFGAPLKLDLTALRKAVPAPVRSVTQESDEDGVKLTFAFDPSASFNGFREDATFVLDIMRPQAAAASAETGVTLPVATEPRRPVPLPNAPAQPAAAQALQLPELPEVPPAHVVVAASAERGPVRPQLATQNKGARITFPFVAKTAAAVFTQDRLVTLVFETDEELLAPAGGVAARLFARDPEPVRRRGITVLRLDLNEPALARLVPENNSWVLTLGDGLVAPMDQAKVANTTSDDGRTLIKIDLPGASGVHWLDDMPDGRQVAVVTAFGPAVGLSKARRYVEFALPATGHGLVVAPLADDILVQPVPDGVAITRDGGLALSPGRVATDLAAVPPPSLAIERDVWNALASGQTRERWRRLADAAAQAPASGRTSARVDLATFLVANDLASEAAGIFDLVARDDPESAGTRGIAIWRGAAALRMGRLDQAYRYLSGEDLADDPEATLWRAAVDAAARRWPAAKAGFQRSIGLLERYPETLQARLLLAMTRVSIETRDFAEAERQFEALGKLPLDASQNAEIALLRGRVDEATGRPDAALLQYDRAIQSSHRPAAAEAQFHATALRLLKDQIKPEDALAIFETLSVSWRGDETEVQALGAMGRLYARTGQWRAAFQTARRSNEIFPDHAVTRALHDETGKLFEDLFLEGKGDTIGRLDALALYYDFKDFTPPGRRGDEMIRRLADRMIELDLLEQAGELLDHQVEHRLSGAARAIVAARLATIRLMDRKPAQALRALQTTRISELPRDVKRARMLLEARALSDLSRTDLAVEMLTGEKGPEVERLRADIYWEGRRWRAAGEAFERLLGDAWRGREPLTKSERLDVMRAAIAYSLAEEAISLDRLQGKYAAKMAQSEDAGAFSFLASGARAGGAQFRAVSKAVASADTLSDFLSEYRKRYPEIATSLRRRQPDAIPGTPAAPGQNAAQPSPPSG